MQGPYLRKYGVETKINFVLYEVDGVDFRVDAADGGSDCSIMKDEGAEATCTNDFVDEGMGYSITLTATEMQAARIVVYVVDSATKVWLDDSIVIETYGHASAQHAFDLDTALASQTVGTCTTNTDMRGTDGANTTVPDAAGTAEALHEITDAAIAALENLSAAEVNAEVDSALNTAIPGSPTAGSINERIKTLDDHDLVTKVPDTISLANINAQVDTALSDINLDHLMKTATAAADMTTEIADNTALSRILANGDTSAFTPSTDGFQPIRDRGDAAWAGAPEACSGTFTVHTADTVFDLTATLGTLSANDDAYNNMIICMYDNSGSVYETRRVTDYDGTNTRVTLDTDLTFPGEDGVDTWVIYRNAYAPVGAASITESDKNDIVDKTWDEPDADHMTIGTKGLKMHHAGRGRY